MKKMVMLFAAITMAIGAHAAAANWQVSAAGIYNGTPDIRYSGAAYIFNAATLTQAALFESFAAGDNITANANLVYTGSVSAGTLSSSVNKFEYGEQGGGTYSYFFALVDGDNIFLSKTMDVVASGTATAMGISFGSQAPTTGNTSKALNTSGTAEIGTWNAVPEPTSGLLMLLGMAGLALKRKVA